MCGLFVIDIILYILSNIYFCIFYSSNMIWIMLDQLLGGGTLDNLDVNRAPGRAEGSFFSVGRPQVCHPVFYYFFVVLPFQDD